LRLACLARDGNMGFNIDAEEADRLDLSLDVIEALLAAPELARWEGFGVVVQAYGKRANDLLDWLYALALRHDRRIMVRLVKGAYWDSEIKRAQELGLHDFPVFTRKAHTDVSYIACARKLLQMSDRIYPQFATHNAHTCAAVLAMAEDPTRFEFQRLHGMGEALHRIMMAQSGVRCRIYAPVGAHRDLLAYLVRRLLENGANSSFVNRIADERVAPADIVQDPFDMAQARGFSANPVIAAPPVLYEPIRRNSSGYDLADPQVVAELDARRALFRAHQWQASAMLAGTDTVAGTGTNPGTDAGPAGTAPDRQTLEVRNPADPADLVGWVTPSCEAQVAHALAAAGDGFAGWSRRAAGERAAILRDAAARFELHAPELHALCTREAGKTLRDAVAEVREAVDFLHYYAAQVERLTAAGTGTGLQGRGVFACISPWNFPLAIFTGQVAAALAAGNAVIAKPAEQTPLIAAKAVSLLHAAGVPAAALQLLPGEGAEVGAALTRSPNLAGVLFTGSTEVALTINRSLAAHAGPDAVLIAETGGINAMVVDSTALPEQAVRDILASAFQSAGQRCSALRMLYLQRDVSRQILEMLHGAMDELRIGDPWSIVTDVGPVIDEQARHEIQAYCDRMTKAGRLLHKLPTPAGGFFVAPHLLEVGGIQDVEREVFGPVLHVATYKAEELDQVVAAINARGYGLTFGLHTRIDDRVQRVVDRIQAGNVYVNRNQIGAVVGSQPFGGEGLSGTGPKAGGPHYLTRLLRRPAPTMPWPDARANDLPDTKTVARSTAATRRTMASGAFSVSVTAALQRLDTSGWSVRGDRLAVLQQLLEPQLGPHASELFEALARFHAPIEMPGPTGESNRLRYAAREPTLCVGPEWQPAIWQAVQALAAGGGALLLVSAPMSAALTGQLRSWEAAGLPIGAVEAGPTDDSDWLQSIGGFGVLAFSGPSDRAKSLRLALARRDGEIKPLVTDLYAPLRYVHERLICIDTTAAGGNASLLAASESDGP
ncbi:MAG: bifunctional proline dehydrogenase/L-glutamate gamma-semialdehyde dehydrogenase PutA, partial [Lautropia sp.]